MYILLQGKNNTERKTSWPGQVKNWKSGDKLEDQHIKLEMMVLVMLGLWIL